MQTWNSAHHLFEILSATGTILGAWALLRTYILSRPKLRLLQQSLWNKNHLGRVNSQRKVGITLLICNPRPQANVIVEWAVLAESENGPVAIPVPSGELVGMEPPTSYGVIPLAIPAFGATESSLCLFEIPHDVPDPVHLTVIATDVHKKRYKVRCVFADNSNGV